MSLGGSIDNGGFLWLIVVTAIILAMILNMNAIDWVELLDTHPVVRSSAAHCVVFQRWNRSVHSPSYSTVSSIV